MYSFHKQDKIFASDLYGRLQWLAYRLAIVNAHTDLPLIFYLLLKSNFLDFSLGSIDLCLVLIKKHSFFSLGTIQGYRKVMYNEMKKAKQAEAEICH